MMVDMITSQEDWARLAAHIERRLDDLRLQWKDIPERGGPSTAKVRELRNGSSQILSRSKRRDLERALQWKPGSVDAVLDGREPTDLHASEDTRLEDASIDQLVEWRGKIEEALRKRFERRWDGEERRGLEPRRDMPGI